MTATYDGKYDHRDDGTTFDLQQRRWVLPQGIREMIVKILQSTAGILHATVTIIIIIINHESS